MGWKHLDKIDSTALSAEMLMSAGGFGPNASGWDE
jgi:hypothetical protein